MMKTVSDEDPIERLIGKGQALGVHANTRERRVSDLRRCKSFQRQVNDSDMRAFGLEEICFLTIAPTDRKHRLPCDSGTHHPCGLRESVIVEPIDVWMTVVWNSRTKAIVVLSFVIIHL